MKINSAAQRKGRERLLIENFIRKASLNAKIVEEREAPDFILCVDSELVGVEITELFISEAPDGNSLQAQEAISSQIAAKAQRLYLRMYRCVLILVRALEISIAMMQQERFVILCSA